MKRGLVVLDPNEIPADEPEKRIAKLQESLQKQGIAAALIYGDVYHSGDITYLCNLCIYWNEGIMVIPAQGEPLCVTKLSGRVHTWMKAISTLKDLRSAPNMPTKIKEYLSEVTPGTVGIVEMDWWPAPVLDSLKENLPGWQLQDLGQVVKTERKRPSGTEMKLLRKGASISAAAVAAGLDPALTNGERAGRAEKLSRMAGVEDVYAYCRPVTDDADAVQVFTEYRGYWTVAARTVLKGNPEWAAKMLAAYETGKKLLKDGANVTQLRDAISAALPDSSIKWAVDIIHHTDLETNGDFRLDAEAGQSIQAGAVAGMRLVFNFDGGAQAVIADTFLITNDGAECLTAID